MKNILFFLSLIFFTSCNNSNNLADTGSCPAALVPTYHSVNLEAETTPVPEYISIELEGELKYDECLENPVISPPPVVRGIRSDSGIEIKVQHFGAYEELPESTSFLVIDRGNCEEEDSIFYEASNVPLEFHRKYPNGVKCGSQTFAESTVQID